MPAIAQLRLTERTFDCVYDPQRFSEPELRDLLADNGAKLFVNREPLAESRNAISHRVRVGGVDYFAKELKRPAWTRRLAERITGPLCFRHFCAAVRLLRAELPTPAPVLAAVLRDPAGAAPGRQVLVTDFCPAAEELDAFFRHAEGDVRHAVLIEVAELLSEFHRRGFASRHLRSANILVHCQAGGRHYWLIDLDRLGTSHVLPQRCYVRTFTRGCADLYEHLSQDERSALLSTAFDYGLKKNVFARPSQQRAFVRQALRQLRARNPALATPPA